MKGERGRRTSAVSAKNGASAVACSNSRPLLGTVLASRQFCRRRRRRRRSRTLATAAAAAAACLQRHKDRQRALLPDTRSADVATTDAAPLRAPLAPIRPPHAEVVDIEHNRNTHTHTPVSYTHLTLPTSDLV